MFQLFELFDLEIRYFIFNFQSFFLIEFLKTVILSCIFLEFVGVIFYSVGPLTEILYLDLLNINRGIKRIGNGT